MKNIIESMHAQTPLEYAVLKSLNRRADDYDNGTAGYLSDVLQGGCQSGIVSELVYYNDTLAFFRRYKKEIAGLLAETLNEYGCKNPSGLFGDKWDSEDPLALDTLNQNLLTWFAFEEKARLIGYRAGLVS